MKIYRKFDEIIRDPDTIVTVGTFDGVHRGHRKILAQALDASKKRGLRNFVLTFHPHPQVVLQTKTKKRIFLLTDIAERLKLFADFGVDNAMVIPFSYEFSQTPPEIFIRDYIHGKIGLKTFLIGYDHLFGKNRAGDAKLLETLGSELDFDVVRVEPYETDGEIISSTKIRHALESGDVEKANEALGYDYFITGRIVEGDRRGRTIGYPTANFNVGNPFKLFPGTGVYLVSSEIDGEKRFGMANIGARPTFTDEKKITVEAHFFNFNKDIYGKELSLAFHKFIRGERKFSGAEALVAQIDLDKEICLKLLKEMKL